MEDWTAIVLAAGKGERMRSSLPKVLHHVAGLPMLTHVLAAASSMQPQRTVVVCSPTNRSAIEAVAPSETVLVEQGQQLGTGHALSCAIEALSLDGQHLIVLNGDLPLLRGDTLCELARLHVDRRAALTLLSATVPAEQAQGLGRIQRAARAKPIAIIEAKEDRRATGSEVEVNVGVYAIEASWLRAALRGLKRHASGEYYLTDLVAIAVADGQRVEALPVRETDEASSVNSRVHLAQVEEAMQWRLRRGWMERGVTLVDPKTAYLDASIELAPDVTVYPNTRIARQTRIGEGCSIGPNASITECNLGPRTVVGSSTLEGVRTDGHVHVGPFCHLRPGTHLEQGVYIGSHVEIKNSRIGAGTHVGHFSYIGDATIGANVNIGAGTVTCNFDGVTKHETHIESGAFIGSDSLLVAPVTIGERAVTGAGAVVTHDVAPGETVAGVPARTLHIERKRTA